MKKFTIDDADFHVTFNRETITVEVYTWEEVEAYGSNDDDEKDGYYLTSQQVYSGYTLSECLIKSLMDIGRIDEGEWAEGIAPRAELPLPVERDHDRRGNRHD